MCFRKSSPLDLGQLRVPFQDLLLEVVQMLRALLGDDDFLFSMNILPLRVAVVRAVEVPVLVRFGLLGGGVLRLLRGPGDHLGAGGATRRVDRVR